VTSRNLLQNVLGSGGGGSTKYLEDGMGLWGDRPLGNEGSTARIEDRRRPLARSNQHEGMVGSWLTAWLDNRTTVRSNKQKQGS
jgi:hypothetical protein